MSKIFVHKPRKEKPRLCIAYEGPPAADPALAHLLEENKLLAQITAEERAKRRAERAEQGKYRAQVLDRLRDADRLAERVFPWDYLPKKLLALAPFALNYPGMKMQRFSVAMAWAADIIGGPDEGLRLFRTVRMDAREKPFHILRMFTPFPYYKEEKGEIVKFFAYGRHVVNSEEHPHARDGLKDLALMSNITGKIRAELEESDTTWNADKQDEPLGDYTLIMRSLPHYYSKNAKPHSRWYWLQLKEGLDIIEERFALAEAERNVKRTGLTKRELVARLERDTKITPEDKDFMREQLEAMNIQ